MGKKYVVMEVQPFGGGYIPTAKDRFNGDGTWIDSRHVISETVLHQRIFAIYGDDQDEIARSVQTLLDPPKAPEGDDEWGKWVDDCPILKNEGMNEILKNWFRKMPKEK